MDGSWHLGFISWPLILWGIIGYGLGSVPFGLLLTRLAGLQDIRQTGSGNIGATNVARTGRRDLALLTFLLDTGKGAAAVLLALYASGHSLHAGMVAGLFAFCGHIYPVWLGFRGGKGVATMLGVALAFWWPAGLTFALVWLGVAGVTRYSSLGGMMAATATPIAAMGAGHYDTAAFFWLLTLLILIKHRGNIARLLSGNEPRIGATKSRPDAPASSETPTQDQGLS